jgi:hypothetical protein
MSIVPRPSILRKLRIALIAMAVFGALLWGGHEWLLSSAQSTLNQRLTERGLSLTYSSLSWSLRGGVTLHDAALSRLSPGNEALIEITFDLEPLRAVLDALQFKPGTGLFSVAGTFNLDLREATATWNAKLHGTAAGSSTT